jgi:hypothetical protein
LVLNLIFTSLMFVGGISSEDLNHLPVDKADRFVSLFYYSMGTFSTTGWSDIYAISLRMKVIAGLFMVTSMSLTITYLVTM